MDPTIPKNDKIILFQSAVQRFEEYETAVKENAQPELLLQHQNDCLNYINDMIAYESSEENSNPYSTALFFIHQDLMNQIEKTDSRKDQIIINDIVISRTSTSSLNTEPLEPTISRILSPTVELNSKKRKIITQTENLEDETRRTIENTLVVSQSSGLSEIAGLEEAKRVLRDTIILPAKFPHLFTGGRKKWNMALLFGPPGTGKTQLAHCLAAEIRARFYCVTTSDLLSSLVGNSEKLLNMLFKHCQETEEQCLIFIDEIDSICRVRVSKESEHERRFKTQLLTELSAMDRNPNNRIFFLACTNCPWDLDPAFLRRFQQRIYIPLPDRNGIARAHHYSYNFYWTFSRESRLQILKLLTKSENIFSPKQWDQILDQTEGWSGSDLTNLVSFAMFQPIQELTSTEKWIITSENMYMPIKGSHQEGIRLTIDQLPANKVTARPVNLSDFFTAFQKVTRTTTQEYIKRFESFNNTFKS